MIPLHLVSTRQPLRGLAMAVWLPVLVVAALIMSGCVSVPSDLELQHNGTSSPRQISNLGVAAVRKDFTTYEDQLVRWGGTIVSVEHEDDHTLIQIISRPIGAYARPVLDDRTDGRFLARVEGFLESGIYAANREITVVGELVSIVDKPIGKADYSFPVVAVKKHRLWRKRMRHESYNHAWLHHRGRHSHGFHDDFFHNWPFWHGHDHRYQSGHGTFYGHFRFQDSGFK